MANKWWCCGVERSTKDRCSCGEKYEEVSLPKEKTDADKYPCSFCKKKATADNPVKGGNRQ